jgi:hypothetical protein
MAMFISYAHNAARGAMTRAVEFVLISMFGAKLKNKQLKRCSQQNKAFKGN